MEYEFDQRIISTNSVFSQNACLPRNANSFFVVKLLEMPTAGKL
jgi:hypothetical protein